MGRQKKKFLTFRFRCLRDDSQRAKKYHKMHNYGLCKHAFPKHFVWAILEMMMSGNHRVVFASSPQEALPPPPLHTGSSRPPGTGQAPP